MGNCQKETEKHDRKEVELESTPMQPQVLNQSLSPIQDKSIPSISIIPTPAKNQNISIGLLKDINLEGQNIQSDVLYPLKPTPSTQSHDKPIKSQPSVIEKYKQYSIEYEDGSTYLGMVDLNSLKPSGKAVFKHSNGDIYEGTFFKGFANGQGTYRHSNGVVYIGSMSQDQKNGYGEEVYENGEVYKGYFQNGQKRGRGKYFWLPNASYDGEIVDNKKHGLGRLVTQKGDVYIGSWLRDRKNGKGRIEYADGDIYEGGFVDNLRSGRGKLITGTYIYEGMFRDDYMDGQGTELDRRNNNVSSVKYNRGNKYIQ